MTVIELVARLFQEIQLGRGDREVVYWDEKEGRQVVKKIEATDKDSYYENDINLIGG